MIDTLKRSLWKQFGASIDMLGNAILLWPEESRSTKKFFYTAYHCLIFLDYYLTIPDGSFSSPLPYTIAASEDEIDREAIDDIVPDRTYSKKELFDWLRSGREKCRRLIGGLTEEQFKGRWTAPETRDDLISHHVIDYSVLEILLYNMKHVQHHTAQLNMLLRQEINDAASWVAQAEDEL